MTDKIDLDFVIEAFDSNDPEKIEAVIDDFILWMAKHKSPMIEEMKKSGIDVKKMTEEVITTERDKVNEVLDKYRPGSFIFSKEDKEKHQ
tara:strand:+ start:244 stop:513 length:270 start_codon:yes stop_codon:yes gene_type:complete